MRFLVFCSVLFATCSASVPYQYQASLTRPESKALQVVVALADLQDNRPLPKPNHPQAFSIFFTSPRVIYPYWFIRYKKAFGLTHLGKKFVPAARVMRDLLYWELSHAGVKVVLLDTWGKNLSQQDLLRMAKEQGANYLMTGQINEFSVLQRKGLNYLGTVGLIAGTGRRVNNYEAEYRLSVARVSDGVSIWGFKFLDDFQEKQKDVDLITKKFFQELLAPILTKGAGFAMDQIEIDILNAEREPALIP